MKKKWQELLLNGFKNQDELLTYLDLDKRNLPYALSDTSDFIMKIPKSFAKNIQKLNPYDPILLQILTRIDETVVIEGFNKDAVGDLNKTHSAILIHKYKSRILLPVTGSCAIHCRYCFRRHYPYENTRFTSKKLQSIRQYIELNPELNEVILSGGDPLSLVDSQIKSLLDLFNALPQITTVRFHTRFPVVIPERIDTDFIALLKSARMKLVFVMHINHPNELLRTLKTKMKRLQNLNVLILNQAVLLRGINDSLIIQKELALKLFEYGILPYYLHQLDRVEGSHHFEVDKAHGKSLISELKKELPGYLVPRYVTEIPGAESKIEF